MLGYEDRASILQGAGDMIFKLMCERSTPAQWAEWLRAPLEHAAGTDNHNLAIKLLKAGADGSAGWKGCHGKTLLHAAAEGGNSQVTTALITAGGAADKNAKTSDKGRTPLHLAALGGKKAALGALIMVGADVDILDSSKDAPLHLAIKGGHPDVAKDLLLSGAKHAVRCSNGDCPIHLAASRGQDEVVLALVHKGTNLDCSDSRGWTPLAAAAAAGEGRVSTVEILLAGGANASRLLPHGKTALHHAAQSNKGAAIPALVEDGAGIDAGDFLGTTPLCYSARFGSCASMLALLRLGADANTQVDGWTALHSACCAGQADAADLLLRWGADETIATNSGRTANQWIPDIAQASEQDRPRLERLTQLLAHAPQDRAWRRRGLMIMCRTNPDMPRIAVETPDNAAAEDIGQQLQERPSRRPRRGQHVEAEMAVEGAHRAEGGGVASSSNSSAGAGGEGVGGGLDGVAAWLMAVTDEGVFRHIVGFL